MNDSVWFLTLVAVRRADDVCVRRGFAIALAVSII